MKETLNILEAAPLFEGIYNNELDAMLKCLNGTLKSYKKDEVIIFIGDDLDEVGIIITGEVLIIKEDIFGNRNIYVHLKAGETFAESFVCAGIKKSPSNIVAATDCSVLYINLNRSITVCSSACVFHSRFIKNLLMIIANKNLMLSGKIELLSKRTIRERLIAYLLEQKKNSGSKIFEIYFDRNGLADFLYVDRSALSRELCKLRDEGLIAFNKNKFEILNIMGLIKSNI